ncbi:MAG: hypothetical protein ACRENJ_11295, partial [Candidatus Eiseniibacteriota bacterium]
GRDLSISDRGHRNRRTIAAEFAARGAKWLRRSNAATMTPLGRTGRGVIRCRRRHGRDDRATTEARVRRPDACDDHAVGGVVSTWSAARGSSDRPRVTVPSLY